MSRLVLDAGAFVAYEKGDARMRARLTAARKHDIEVVTSAPVVGQVWRSPRQVDLARLLPGIRVDAPGETAARRAGELLAKTKTTDVVDALVVVLARDHDTIVTSDEIDLRRLVEAADLDVTLVKP